MQEKNDSINIFQERLQGWKTIPETNFGVRKGRNRLLLQPHSQGPL